MKEQTLNWLVLALLMVGQGCTSVDTYSSKPEENPPPPNQAAHLPLSQRAILIVESPVVIRSLHPVDGGLVPKPPAKESIVRPPSDEKEAKSNTPAEASRTRWAMVLEELQVVDGIGKDGKHGIYRVEQIDGSYQLNPLPRPYKDLKSRVNLAPGRYVVVVQSEIGRIGLNLEAQAGHTYRVRTGVNVPKQAVSGHEKARLWIEEEKNSVR